VSLCLLWPCRCIARMDISAEAEAAATTQDLKVWRSGLCSAVRSVGSTMSVIGSSQVVVDSVQINVDMYISR
jgi:hypothetical protein